MKHQVIAELAAERLAKAMELIKNPKYWCQGGMGRDEYGGLTVPWADYCVQRCALGSVIAVSQGSEDPVYYLAVSTLEAAAEDQRPGYGVIATNDSFPAEKSHEKVMALFPVAIENLRAQAARRKTEMGIPTAPAVWSAQMTTQHAAAIQPAA